MNVNQPTDVGEISNTILNDRLLANVSREIGAFSAKVMKGETDFTNCFLLGGI